METIESTSEIIVTGLTAPDIIIDPVAMARRDTYLSRASEIVIVNDGETQKYAVDIMKQLKSFEKGLESSRELVKRPVLEIGRKIDALSKDCVMGVQDEYKRISKLVSIFQDKQDAEAERIRKEEEQKRIKAMEDAENKRLELEAKANAAKSATEKLKILQKQDQLQAKLDSQIIESVKAENLSAPVRTSGMIVKRTWKHRIIDIKKLYATRPDLCKIEENSMSIRGAIAGGLRQCDGMEIYEDVQTSVRA
jgi:hypothetical protein